MDGYENVNVNSSISFDLSFYDSENNEYPISSDKNKEFDIWIGRNELFSKPNYTQINANQFNMTAKKQIYVAGYQTKGVYISTHIYLKPIDLNSAYLVLIKFNDFPILNSTNQDYDYLKIFCPKGKNKRKFEF